jgi:hypothetical protein
VRASRPDRRMLFPVTLCVYVVNNRKGVRGVRRNTVRIQRRNCGLKRNTKERLITYYTCFRAKSHYCRKGSSVQLTLFPVHPYPQIIGVLVSVLSDEHIQDQCEHLNGGRHSSALQNVYLLQCCIRSEICAGKWTGAKDHQFLGLGLASPKTV